LIDGGTIRLPRLIGSSRANDMMLTGRPVSADEALHIGLANRVVPKGTARQAAELLAAQIAKFPQPTMRADRMSSYVQDGLSVQDALRYEFEYALSHCCNSCITCFCVHRVGQPMVLEGVKGATKFFGGAGRGGSFDDSKVTTPTLKKNTAIKAVLFDIGGVVCGSPLLAISRYQKGKGIATGSLGKIFVKSRAFELLETGKVFRYFAPLLLLFGLAYG
jgi:hypothetical protein